MEIGCANVFARSVANRNIFFMSSSFQILVIYEFPPLMNVIVCVFFEKIDSFYIFFQFLWILLLFKKKIKIVVIFFLVGQRFIASSQDGTVIILKKYLIVFFLSFLSKFPVSTHFFLFFPGISILINSPSLTYACSL